MQLIVIGSEDRRGEKTGMRRYVAVDIGGKGPGVGRRLRFDDRGGRAGLGGGYGWGKQNGDHARDEEREAHNSRFEVYVRASEGTACRVSDEASEHTVECGEHTSAVDV